MSVYNYNKRMYISTCSKRVYCCTDLFVAVPWGPRKKKFDGLQKSYHKTLPIHTNLFLYGLLMAIIQTSFWRVLFSFLQCVPKKLLFWTPCIYLVFWRFDRIIFWGMSKLWTKTFNFFKMLKMAVLLHFKVKKCHIFCNTL